MFKIAYLIKKTKSFVLQWKKLARTFIHSNKSIIDSIWLQSLLKDNNTHISSYIFFKHLKKKSCFK